MTIEKRELTKAEIEKLRKEGWRFGTGLDWREFVPGRKLEGSDQAQTEAPPRPSPDNGDERDG